ncbi:Uncharacterised protein [[Flavobacterium] thermophilum]|nr:Uncharacterised protein [[Flavobacterium] thermophilum]
MQFGNIVVQGENLLLVSSLLISYVMFYYGIKILKIERNIMDLIFNSFINGVALHHKVYLTKKDDYDKENQNSIFPFYTTHLFEQHCYHVCL